MAQSAAASFNPAHKLIDQHTEAPIQYRIKKRMESQEDAMELYERLRLPNPREIGFRYPHQVSGGQLQRAMTAMAMACRPDLIIFDEPTTALDVTTQIEVLAAIRDIVDQFNTAAIYITHDLAVVAQMADVIKVLLKGDEVEEADTETMLENPQGGLHQVPLGGAQLQAQAEVRRPTRWQCPLSSRWRTWMRLTATSRCSRTSPFDVYAGMTVAVVGESGSGKSTTARCITGLLPPTKGASCSRARTLPSTTGDRTKDQLVRRR